jgi:LysM repeat protein
MTEAKKMYPDFEVEGELWLYRSILVPVVVEYTVEKGDNLWNIANDYGITVDDLYELNPEIDKNTNIIQPGQKLILDQFYDEFIDENDGENNTNETKKIQKNEP